MKSSSNMTIIGLTGGIGSGKSTASHFFKERGIVVLCADTIAHQVIQPGTTAYKKIVHFFGKEILSPNKSINRQSLGALVFQNRSHLKQLNLITHPEVLKEFKKQIRHFKNERLVILDVPLLFESGMDKLCNYIILVSLSKKLQTLRIRKRDGLSETEIKKRIDSQMSLAEKRKRSDFIIDNSGTLAKTKKQIEKILSAVT